MSSHAKLTGNSLNSQLTTLGHSLLRFRVVLFVLLVALLYGFVNYKVLTLSNSDAASQTAQDQVTDAGLRVDTKVVEQLQSLKDNSVNVQTLFSEARQNPFAE